MTSLRIFFLGGLTSFRALFGWVSPWIYMPTLVIGPLFQILLFAYIGRTTGIASDKFFVIGNALQYASIPCLFAMTNTVAGERHQNTLAYILVSPAGRIPIFLGRALPVVVNGAFVAALALLLGGLVLGVHVAAGSLAPLAFVILVTAYSCTGFGLISAGLGPAHPRDGRARERHLRRPAHLHRRERPARHAPELDVHDLRLAADHPRHRGGEARSPTARRSAT